MACESICRNRARLLGRLGFDSSRAQFLKRCDTPFTDYLFGNFMYCRKDATDTRSYGFVGNRTVCNGEMRFLEEAMAVQFEFDVLHPSGRTAVKWCLDQWFENMPDFVPNLFDRL